MSWEARLGVILICISITIFSLKYLILDDPANIYNYIFNSLGFLPINVLLVTLILNSLLSKRARQNRMEKLNMIIGTFFSEVGTWLLSYLSDSDPEACNLQGDLTAIPNWPEQEFERVQAKLETHDCRIDTTRIDLKEMHTFLKSRRDFMLRLLENPALLEHESFTGLTRAVFHLAEELEWRKDLDSLPPSDLEHLSADMSRVYRLLINEWLSYMRYLKRNHPYLFSLAMRTNPFDERASAIVR